MKNSFTSRIKRMTRHLCICSIPLLLIDFGNTLPYYLALHVCIECACTIASLVAYLLSVVNKYLCRNMRYARWKPPFLPTAKLSSFTSPRIPINPSQLLTLLDETTVQTSIYTSNDSISMLWKNLYPFQRKQTNLSALMLENAKCPWKPRRDKFSCINKTIPP